MDYKEKYEQALEVAQRFYNNSVAITKKGLEDIFPELAESEDEKIRKAILNWFLQFKQNDMFNDDISFKDILAWLEKQGEQKPVVDTKVIIPKFRVGDIVKSKSQPMLSPRKIISIGKDCYWCEDRGCIGFAWEDDCEIVEQNPTNKVEPKFKVGDRIYLKPEHRMPNDDTPIADTIHEIIAIDDKHYRFEGAFIFIEDQDKFELVEQKPVWSEEDEIHIRELESLVKRVWAIAEHENNEDTIHKMSDLSFFLKTLKPQLKQDEQKLADKVEPKFKVGDWISGYYTNYKVLSVNNNGYVVEDVDGNKINILFENEKFHHLWMIQDAKDGDVLVCIGKYGQEIGIVKEYVGKYGGCNKCFETYCFVDWGGIFRTGEYIGSKEIYPATKEQRVQLEKAMTDAGYTFDFKNKELKKIEQKPAWSEEDYIEIKRITGLLEGWASTFEKTFYEKECKRGVAWLKNLKDRVLPQPKQEWSEEDNAMLINIENILIGRGHSFHDKEINWLKSLRPQSQWKPSDEQIKALEHFVRSVGESGYTSPYDNNTKLLYSLLSDLKKLRCK